MWSADELLQIDIGIGPAMQKIRIRKRPYGLSFELYQ